MCIKFGENLQIIFYFYFFLSHFPGSNKCLGSGYLLTVGIVLQFYTSLFETVIIFCHVLKIYDFDYYPQMNFSVSHFFHNLSRFLNMYCLNMHLTNFDN